MRLLVVSIGRLKQGPERELAERYRERFDDIGRKLGFRGLEIHEIPESRARDAATRIAEEAAAISTAIPEKSVLVTLDERGKSVDSATFAQQLGRWRDEGVANTIFTIGGARTDFRPICSARLSCALRSARRPGRIKWFASCFWNRFIGPRPFWPAIPITAPRHGGMNTESADQAE